MSKRRPPHRFTENDIEFFELSDETVIKQLARGQTEKEVLDWWVVEYDDLSDKDKFFFDVCYRRGQTEARNEAIDKLFRTMSDKNGHVPCLEYLQRFAEKWPDANAGSLAPGTRAYKLTIE